MNRNARYALAGLQAGVAGAIGLLIWLLLASRFFGKSLWSTPNLLSGIFYGDSSIRHSFGLHTWSGFALVFFLYGLVGIVFGLCWRERPGGSTAVFMGIAFAVGTYYLLVRWMWREVSPATAIYAPDRQLLAGHILFGFVLACYTRFRGGLA